ncbi:MAG: response regulator [Kofleriaceae bacterium]
MGNTVLLVDDSAIVRSVLQVVLENEQLELLEAEDGDRAWQLIRLVPVDLVIADINMPGADGITLLERMRAATEPRLRDLPVVLLTADLSTELEARGRGAGANAFVHKPVAPATLVGHVRRLLAERVPS